MEIRVLKYFLAVAREGSITGAANSLHLTQPTLTRQIKDLEEELGQQLFIRGKYRVTLTPEGMILRRRAEEILELVSKTESEFLAIGSMIKGDVYIGCGESDAMKYVAEIIRDVRTAYPDIKFHIYSGNAGDVTERLDRGFLDFGILIQPVDVSKYEHVPLPEKDLWGVIMRKDSLLASKEEIAYEDLKGLPLLLSRQAVARDAAENNFARWFRDDFENLNVAGTFNLIYNATVMVKAGIGYAVSIDRLVNMTGESELCFRPLKPKLEAALDVVWLKSRLFSAAAKFFKGELESRFGERSAE